MISSVLGYSEMEARRAFCKGIFKQVINTSETRNVKYFLYWKIKTSGPSKCIKCNKHAICTINWRENECSRKINYDHEI